jgi:hypothetical protein
MQENHNRVKYIMTVNTFVPLAHVHVRDRDYCVYISMCTVTQHVHVFKYNESRYTCEYEVFDELSLVSDYLEEILDPKRQKRGRGPAQNSS